MSIKVLMPQLGESVFEGTLSKWLKTEGERVNEYDPLLEVTTDKVDTEIPSPATGVLLKVIAKEGELVRVGATLALIGNPEESPESAPLAVAALPSLPVTSAPLLPLSPSASHDRDLGFISPVVAKLAREHQLDLSQIQGSGLNGRITKKDVLEHLGKFGAGKLVEEEVAAQMAPPSSPVPQLSSIPASLPGEVLPHTTVRRAIAEHMVLSKRTSPHVTTVMEADMSRVVAHRQGNKETFAREEVNLTFTAYFISAIVTALKAYPLVNSSWSDEGIIIHRAINVGMATSLGEGGLIVPVIKNADGLSLLGLARTINDLAQRARARQLKPDEVRGGTFTITNHGVSGSLFATPIINQPQCGILGVGAIQKRVVVVDDMIAIRPMAYLSLTFDHRILDGAIADYFLGKVVESLTNWT